jgi:Zn-finger nucleic acid-binding protein
MACPTCSHTMQNLGVESERVFWCPRCGTIKTVRGERESVEAPRWIRLAAEDLSEALAREMRVSLNLPVRGGKPC